MDDIYVGRLMTADPVTVSPDTLVEDAANLMLEEDIGSLVVTDGDDHLLGILTTTDFVRIVAERQPKDETPVQAYMTTNVVATTAQATIQGAADTMLSRGVHHLPVTDPEAGVIGILTTTDLTSYISGFGP